MSFRTSTASLPRRFDLVRRSLLQAPGLPFADTLSAEQIQHAFDAEDVHFGDDDEVVYTPAVTLWAMLSQMLFTAEQAFLPGRGDARRGVLRDARSRRIAGPTPAPAPAPRAKVPQGVPRRLTLQVAGPAAAKRRSRRPGAGRDATCGSSMGRPSRCPIRWRIRPSTPQSSSQAEGLGFPILRVVALCSLATGMVMAMACGPYAGKKTGETALLRTLFDTVSRGDVVLGDRYYGGWFMLALLQDLGVDFVSVCTSFAPLSLSVVVGWARGITWSRGPSRNGPHGSIKRLMITCQHRSKMRRSTCEC